MPDMEKTHSGEYTEKVEKPRETDQDSVREDALGDDLPPGYFYSLQFIGTMTVSQALICFDKSLLTALGILSRCTFRIHILDPSDECLDLYQR